MADDRDLERHSREVSNREARHENRGVNVRAIVAIASVVVLLTVASVFMLNGLFRYFETRENLNRTRPAGVDNDSTKLPPEPRLQENAVQDLQQMRSAEDQVLNSYGWVDQKKSVVRIPIDRAIDLLAQRGLPVRAAHGKANNTGNAGVPAEAGAAVHQPGGPLADQAAAGRP